MTDYTVTATLHVETSADRDRVQSLLDQGLRELSSIAGRYGVTITDSSARVEELAR
jgi:hypothetical protein